MSPARAESPEAHRPEAGAPEGTPAPPPLPPRGSGGPRAALGCGGAGQPPLGRAGDAGVVGRGARTDGAAHRPGQAATRGAGPRDGSGSGEPLGAPCVPAGAPNGGSPPSLGAHRADQGAVAEGRLPSPEAPVTRRAGEGWGDRPGAGP